MEVTELRPGLWRWTGEHPEWDHAESWGPEVGSVYAELPEAVVVVDPLVPADDEERFWAALDRDVERSGLPLHVLLTVHWHERSVATVLDRYHAELWRPEEKGDLPAGVHAEVVKGSDWMEALFFLEPHRALVTGDLLIGRDGGIELPVEWFPKDEREWAENELKPDLRERLAGLPIELVLVSHGQPVLENGAEALQRALTPD
jgi:glyoxylase-like metal-dependent hydrolase (beta-lactamase superfamily II)